MRVFRTQLPRLATYKVYNRSVNELFDILESKGLLSERHVTRIEHLSGKDSTKLYERVYSYVFDEQNRRLPPPNGGPELDPFTFFAGASLRGDSTCWEATCRVQKLDFLGRYAALYANEVTVPLPLTHPTNLNSTEQAKALLSLSSITLLRLRPLINVGIIKPAVMRTTHCVHTIKWVKKMTAVVHELVGEEVKRSMPDFKTVYQIPEKAPTRRPTVYIEGPRTFLEHGDIVMTLNDDPRWGAKTWKYNKDGKIELKGSRKLWILSNVFEEIASTTTFYLAYGRLHKARLLTDLPGETFVLNWLTSDENLAATTSAMRYLAHSVPILGDLSIATVLRIRREERDSFESYRRAITRIASDVLGRARKLSRKEAQEMFKASIEPELTRLRNEIRYERRRQTKRVAGGLATLAAGIAIGAFGGLPVAIGAAVKTISAVAGGRLLGKAGEVACEHGANLRQQNDLYFLLRLEDEATG
jgi:hypothetical protein